MLLELKRIITKDTKGNISIDFHMIRSNRISNSNFILVEGEVLNSPISVNIKK